MSISFADPTTVQPAQESDPDIGMIWFVIGDSIGQGFDSTTDRPSTAYPSRRNSSIWSQHSVDYPGSRFSATTTAGTRFIPYGPGHGLVGGAGEGSIDPTHYFGQMMSVRNPNVHHYFAKWAVSGAQLNTTPTNSTVGLIPGATGNTSFVDVHAADALADFNKRYGPGRKFCGGLIAISLAGDASSVGEGSYVAGADTAYATNATTIIDDFRTVHGFTDAECPVWWARAPTVGAGVTTLDRLSTVRTQTDSLDASNGITVIDIDATERAADEVHRTAKGSAQVAGFIVDEIVTSAYAFQPI